MLLAFTWWLAGDYVKDSVQKQLTRPQAQIRVQHGKDARYVIRVEITPYSSEAFEEVKVEVDLSLRSTSNDIEGHVSSVDGSTRAVDITMLPEGRAFEVTSLKDKRGPITLQQREALEIRFHEASSQAVGEVWLYSKDRPLMRSSDLNQRWPLADIVWRLVLVFFLALALCYVFKLLIRVFSRKSIRQLDEDVDFLHKCWQQDAQSLARFRREFQGVIDAGTAEYLKALDASVRQRLQTVVIPEEIFRRATTLPRFRHSLQGEVHDSSSTSALKCSRENIRRSKKSRSGTEPASNEMSEPSVLEIVRRCQEHPEDRVAFDSFYRAFYPYVLLYVRAFRLPAAPLTDEDIVQEIFLRVMEHFPEVRFKNERHFLGYLKAVCEHYLIDMVRRYERQTYRELTEELQPIAPGESPETAAANAERLNALIELVGELPGPCRNLLVAFLKEGLSLAEIARDRNISVGTIYPRFSRCVAELRRRVARSSGGRL